MEANEAHELQEHQEHGAHDASMRPISFTMSVLAVLVAITTVLGHRTHTEAVLSQARASDQWNEYQAKKIRQYNTSLNADLLMALTVRDAEAARKTADAYRAHSEKWNDDLKEAQEEARKLEGEVKLHERRANRFDLGEALLEIALVVSSITLLTRQRAYWILGLVFGAIGLVVAATAFLVR